MTTTTKLDLVFREVPQEVVGITLAQALEGYKINVEARNLSPNTLKDYYRTFARFVDFVGSETRIDEITRRDIEQFILSLNGLSKKTKLNHHIALSALWTWLVGEDLAGEHIVRQVKAPRPEQRAIDPFTQQEVKQMLAAISTQGKYRLRNKAIFFLMLDTGVRASELCGLMLADTNLKNQQIKVFGKGAKERIIPISPKTARIVWRYLITRPKDTASNEPLVLAASQLPLTRSGLLKLCDRVGRAAGVEGVHPHRFRHTFAINFLRNGGDAYTLQAILGHSSLNMVRRYLSLAVNDVQAKHKIASPVMNWRLS